MAKRTKIVCTLGPAVDNQDTLQDLLAAGMDVARLNFSHGSHQEHAARIARVRSACARENKPCAILLDTRGPEIRTGTLENGTPVTLRAGDGIALTEDDVAGTAQRISQNCIGLAAHVQPETLILIDDGLVELRVERVDGTDIACRVLNDAVLGERKSVNVPGVRVPLPAVTEQDRADLLFGIEQDVDFVAASFIRDAAGVREVKEFLADHGGWYIGVIAKIESADAVANIDEIVQAADGVMVARGDLGVEVPAHKVPHIQKQIIRRCNEAYKPVITATQMLDSMIRNPRPTRAEVGDVANAIYDGTDAVMLSGETAAGRYPVEAVRMMARIAEASEPYLFEDGKVSAPRAMSTELVSLAVGTAAVQTAENIGATCIVAPTMTGRTARLISNFRSPVPIYSVTPIPRVQRAMQLYWGVTPLFGDASGDMRRVIEHARDVVRDRGYVKPGDIAVFTSGDQETSPQPEADEHEDAAIAPTNVMYVVQIRAENPTEIDDMPV